MAALVLMPMAALTVMGSRSPTRALSRVARSDREGDRWSFGHDAGEVSGADGSPVSGVGFVDDQVRVRGGEAVAVLEGSGDGIAGGGVERHRLWPAHHLDARMPDVMDVEPVEVSAAERVQHRQQAHGWFVGVDVVAGVGPAGVELALGFERQDGPGKDRFGVSPQPGGRVSQGELVSSTPREELA